MKKYILLFAVCTINVFAQNGNMRDNRLENKGDKLKPLYTSQLITPKGNDSVTSAVCLRIPYNTLSFKRTAGTNKGEYSAVVDMNISYKNSEQIIKSRSKFTDTLFVASAVEENLKNMFYTPCISNVLLNDNYQINIEVSDENRRQIASNSSLRIDKNMPTFPEFLTYNSVNGEFVTVLDSAFDCRAREMNIYISAVNSENTSQLSYEIKRINQKNQIGFTFYETATQSGKTDFLNISPKIATDISDNKVLFEENESIKSAKIVIDAQCMQPGLYELVYRIGEGEKHTKMFEVLYLNQPKSLREREMAVVAMENLMTEQEFEALQNADENVQYKIIADFFRPTDPNPQTPFLENMHEYFRRIDYGMINFVDPQNMNGSNTARGKVYALFGSPNEINSTLEAEMSREIWTYNNPTREVIFEISKGGFYKLIEIKPSEQK